MDSEFESINDEENNPWSVADIEQFLYFCCPECDVKDQSIELFMQHAFDQHPKAKASLLKLKVKKEIYENDIVNDEQDYLDYMSPKCEIKCETRENYENGEEICDEDETNSILEKSDNNGCFACSKEFKSPWHLKRHIESVHAGIRHECNFCEKSFSQIAFLKKHKRDSHQWSESNQRQSNFDEDGNRKEYHCEVCYKDFDNIWHFKRHNESVHEGIRHKCDLCDKSYRYCLRILTFC